MEKFLTLLFYFRINLKNLKSFFPRINYKIPISKLREIFDEVDSRKREEIGFDDFTVLYQKAMLDEAVSIKSVIIVDYLDKITSKMYL